MLDDRFDVSIESDQMPNSFAAPIPANRFDHRACPLKISGYEPSRDRS